MKGGIRPYKGLVDIYEFLREELIQKHYAYLKAALKIYKGDDKKVNAVLFEHGYHTDDDKKVNAVLFEHGYHIDDPKISCDKWSWINWKLSLNKWSWPHYFKQNNNLTAGNIFNKDIDDNLNNLAFDLCLNKDITYCLPHSLTHLKLREYFNKNTNNIPTSVIKIKISKDILNK